MGEIDKATRLQDMQMRMEVLRLAVNSPKVEKDDKLRTAKKWWDEFIKPGG